MKMIPLLRLPRWNDVLLEIYKSGERNPYCEKLNRSLKASLTHIRDIVKSLAEHSLVEVKPNHKIKRLALTKRGKRVAVWIFQIKAELNRQDNQE